MIFTIVNNFLRTNVGGLKCCCGITSFIGEALRQFFVSVLRGGFDETVCKVAELLDCGVVE
jgi:hypothetical protein